MVGTIESPRQTLQMPDTSEAEFSHDAKRLAEMQEHMIDIFNLRDDTNYRIREDLTPPSITAEVCKPLWRNESWTIFGRQEERLINFTAFIIPEQQGFYQNTGEVQQKALDEMEMGNRYVLSIADDFSYITYHFDKEGRSAAFTGIPGNPPQQIEITEDHVRQAEEALILARHALLSSEPGSDLMRVYV